MRHPNRSIYELEPAENYPHFLSASPLSTTLDALPFRVDGIMPETNPWSRDLA